MKFCQYCGSENYEGSSFCECCGKPMNNSAPVIQPPVQEQNYVQPPVQEQNYAQPFTQGQAYVQPQSYDMQPIPPQKKTKSKTPLIVAVILVALIAIAAILVFSHTICIFHEYSQPTCEEAAICEYCDKEGEEALGHDYEDATCLKAKVCKECEKVDGEPLGHNWNEANCTSAKTCAVCGETEGEALGHEYVGGSCTVAGVCSRCNIQGTEPAGHIEGLWETTQKATIVSGGYEELSCSKCGEVIDTKDTPVKDPAVDGESFNFTEDELLEWLEEEGYEIDYEYHYIDGWGYAYDIYTPGGEHYGFLFIETDNSGNVNCISFCLEDNSYALACAIVLAEAIDPLYSEDAAISAFANNNIYTDAQMTIAYFEAEDGVYMATLLTNEYYDNL